MQALSDRTASFTDSVIRRMTRISNQYGAVPIYVPLTPPSFTFDPEVLEDAFRQHPKALVLCNPSNPCGKVFTREELEIIAGLAKKYDVYVITDEVYEHIIYAPHQHT